MTLTKRLSGQKTGTYTGDIHSERQRRISVNKNRREKI